MARRRVLPPTYFLVAIILMGLLHFAAPVTDLVSYPWNLIGGAPLVVGLALNLVADAAFKKHNTTVKPFQESAALITTGVFGISRHPMYLGMILMLVGLGILLSSLTPLLVIPIFSILMERVFVRAEEDMLAQKFGEAWRAYRKRVRRWL